MSDALLTPVVTIRFGRTRTLHRLKLDIEDNKVIIRALCGLRPSDDGFTESFAIPTCETCEEAS